MIKELKNDLNNDLNNEKGSMVVEAAIIMPFFLAFVLAMISFVQIAVIEMALQSSVSETTKQISTHIYPIYLLSQSDKGQDVQSILDKVYQAKEQYSSALEFSSDYSALIPNALLDLMKWINGVSEAGASKAVLSVILLYEDSELLNTNKMEVLEASLPSMKRKTDAYFSITVGYKLKLILPFIHKELHIRKKAVERVWIGD